MVKNIHNDDGSNITDVIVHALEEQSVTIYVNEFSEESARDFYFSFSRALKSGQKIIPIVIDSYGGSADSLIAMMDVIYSSPVPVATLAVGKAMSCGAFLLSCGTEGMRFIGPNSRVMIHGVSSGLFGKLPEVKHELIEMNRMQDMMFKNMAKNCGKPVNYFLKLLEKKGNLDWYLTPQECLKHNIVNHIRVPMLRTKMLVGSILE